MCPFCIGAAAWAAAGAVSAGGFGVLEAIVQHRNRTTSADDATAPRGQDDAPGPTDSG